MSEEKFKRLAEIDALVNRMRSSSSVDELSRDDLSAMMQAVNKALEFRESMINLEAHAGISQEELQQVKGGILKMSEQKSGFFFSCNADKSAHDYTIFAQSNEMGNIQIGARYKNSPENKSYEIEMDADDLVTFGNMCIDLAAQLRRKSEQRT